MLAKKLLITAIVGAATIGFGLVAADSAPQKPQEQPTSSGVVKVTDCTLQWKDERILSSKIPGRLERRLVKEGDRVEPEQVLAVLDDQDARIEYEIQKMLGESELAIQVQNEKLEEYRTRRTAADILGPSRAMNKEDWRLAWVNERVNELLSKQEVEKHNVESLKAKLAKVRLEDHIITSPIKGRIEKCFKREKESVAANDLQVFRVVATDVLWVSASVPEQHFYRVREGQRVNLNLKFQDVERQPIELPESKEIFTGRITFVASELGVGTHTFNVLVEVENRKDLLRAQLHGALQIFVDEPVSESKSSNDGK